MLQNRTATRLVVLASLLSAMILRIMPLPAELFIYNPDWMLLFLIYWAIAIPERVGVGYAWAMGLLSDVLTGRMLGQHALAYSVVIFACVKLHNRLRAYPLFQQTISVLLLLLISQILISWTQNIKSAIPFGFIYWLPSVVGALVWPAILPLLRLVRRAYNIA